MRLPTTPIGALMTEHRIIQRVGATMAQRLDLIASDRRIDPAYIDIMADFFRTYADKCHHGKEEDILFRRLEDKPLSEEHRRIMDGLVEDHRFSRETIGRLVVLNDRYRQGDTSALDEIEAAMKALMDLYPRHIETEDHVFFKPAIDYFTQDERKEMEREFEEFDRTLFHERYLQTVESLEAGLLPQLV